MIDLDIGGACPRQQLTCALSQALGLPTDPGAGTDSLTIGTMDYPSEPALEMVARAAMQARQDSLMALFANDHWLDSRCGRWSPMTTGLILDVGAGRQ